jgi:hypothetical protein
MMVIEYGYFMEIDQQLPLSTIWEWFKSRYGKSFGMVGGRWWHWVYHMRLGIHTQLLYSSFLRISGVQC